MAAIVASGIRDRTLFGLPSRTMSEGPVENEPVVGINVPEVTDWFETHADGVVPPLSFQLIAGGHSNLTFKVTDRSGRSWVLRRPPLGQVLATAHDMGREHRIISALTDTDVPVAPVVGLCTDDAVNGAPFYVMDFVDGRVLRDVASAEALTPAARGRAGQSLMEVLGRIHAIDPDAVGLGELGRKQNYLGRQLKRWNRQWEQSKMRELPVIDRVFERLSADVPEQLTTGIVHGDYRLDNCMVDEDGEVIAVLDWELCTLGDPMADLGLLMVYWVDPEDEFSPLAGAPTTLDGFPRKADLLARYAEISGRDVSAIDYYTAFGYWKLACIIEGVYARYAGGSMGTNRAGAEAFGEQVVRLGEAAEAALARMES
jgi:aminoglycoside phosphotransferase (APT) family kinase protein